MGLVENNKRQHKERMNQQQNKGLGEGKEREGGGREGGREGRGENGRGERM